MVLNNKSTYSFNDKLFFSPEKTVCLIINGNVKWLCPAGKILKISEEKQKEITVLINVHLHTSRFPSHGVIVLYNNIFEKSYIYYFLYFFSLNFEVNTIIFI